MAGVNWPEDGQRAFSCLSVGSGVYEHLIQIDQLTSVSVLSISYPVTAAAESFKLVFLFGGGCYITAQASDCQTESLPSILSALLAERGRDSIRVGCRAGMIVEVGICVFIIGDCSSASSYLKMTQHG